ncbi:hypothetical protein [Ciceribacter sp. RN22]|uniref:hypothetical protein n=1 Tax=Ciceribacter sp. RN22 TaxID=2954932 RepID=UPI002093B984|nr:hypothetical protein [Ciceribacter sp. RN22]MCO6177072.1 hypothetical protein [Ciceribacter sp. RN22]
MQAFKLVSDDARFLSATSPADRLFHVAKVPSMRCITRDLQLALSLIVVAALSGCDMLGFHEWQWRQKLTVSVMTPEGLKSGSSVTSARIEFPPKWTGVGDAAGMQRGGVTGEAVALDLGEGRYLFALLQGYTEWTAYTAFFPELEGKALLKKEIFPYLDRLVANTGQSRDVPREHYPLLVTFDDIADPTSVKRVDPANFEASFGPGYRLKSIAMSITDESVIEGRIQKMLEWLGPYPEPKLSPATGRTTDIPFSRSVSHGDFIRR